MFHTVLRLLFLLYPIYAEKHWGYEDCDDELDPDHWHDVYENCRGLRQSPIDIEKEDVEYDPKLKPFVLHGYEQQIKKTRVINDGHTVTVDIPDEFEASMTVPSLNSTYRLVQFHFHWGHDDNTGSEHVVFNEHFPLELHMVHFEQNITFEQALTEPYGIVVLSVLFRIGKENKELNKLTNLFHLIADPESNFTSVRNINLLQLLPKDYKNYLQYSGSLTTPPCNEAVEWIILTHTAQISHSQMLKFRRIQHEHHTPNGTITKEEYAANDRAIQNINDRKIQLHFSFDDLSNNFYDDLLVKVYKRLKL